MAKFDPQGRGHQALRFLTEGPASMPVLKDHIAKHKTSLGRKQSWHIIEAMLTDGLIEKGNDMLWITRVGRGALEDLDAGIVFWASAPSVRVFDYQPRKAA